MWITLRKRKVQAAALKQHNQSQPDVRPEVVIVSPMTRAIETAVGAFGGGKWQNGDHSQPLMVEQSAQRVRLRFSMLQEKISRLSKVAKAMCITQRLLCHAAGTNLI